MCDSQHTHTHTHTLLDEWLTWSQWFVDWGIRVVSHLSGKSINVWSKCSTVERMLLKRIISFSNKLIIFFFLILSMNEQNFICKKKMFCSFQLLKPNRNIYFKCEWNVVLKIFHDRFFVHGTLYPVNGIFKWIQLFFLSTRDWSIQMITDWILNE